MKGWIIAVKIFNYVRGIVSRTLDKFGITDIRVSLSFYQGKAVVREFYKDFEVK